MRCWLPPVYLVIAEKLLKQRNYRTTRQYLKLIIKKYNFLKKIWAVVVEQLQLRFNCYIYHREAEITVTIRSPLSIHVTNIIIVYFSVNILLVYNKVCSIIHSLSIYIVINLFWVISKTRASRFGIYPYYFLSYF